MRRLGRLLWDAAGGWMRHGAMNRSAALAFYVLFSLAPMLFVAVAIAAVFFSPSDSQQDILRQARRLVGDRPAALVATLLHNRRQFASTASLVLGGVVLFYSAAGMFSTVQQSMNEIWGLRPAPGAGWTPLLRKRLLTFLMVVILGGFVVVSLAISQALSYVSRQDLSLPLDAGLWRAANYAATYSLLLLFLAVVYRVLPDAKIPWPGVWVGAVVASVLFVAGNIVIGVYVSLSREMTAYGAAASVLAFLLWVYYSGMIFFFGAEIARAYTDLKALPVKPNKYAVRQT